MKKNFLKAASLFLSLMMLLCACGDETQILGTGDETINSATTSADHVHSFGEWNMITQATCATKGFKERICSECGYKVTQELTAKQHSYGDWQIVTEATCTSKGFKERTCSECGYKATQELTGQHRYGNWVTQKTATCTSSGSEYRTCIDCDKKETKTIAAKGHNYENYKCTNCGDCKLNINIKLPQTPVTIHDYSYDDSIKTSCKVTSIRWEVDWLWDDGRVDIYIYWSGEQIYNYKGDNISSSCEVGYKLYDSQGYVVESGTTGSTAVQKGEKFKDAAIWIIFLDPNESYTLEFLDVK